MPFYRLCLATLLDNPAFIPSHPAFDLVARHLIRQMCHAVAYLESRNIAHRDIAPSNWVIEASGSVALVDFGVAWTSEDPGQEGSSNLQFELGTGCDSITLQPGKLTDNIA
jgi:cyclin-dependent kinase 8/11